ncbi:hypothetical protein Tco_1399058 [Tanacetum coccineum]
MLYICVNLALEAGQKLKTCTTEEGLLQQLNYAKEHIGSLADFYKDTGHLPYDWEYHPDTANSCVPCFEIRRCLFLRSSISEDQKPMCTNYELDV